jgi:hypothetical protein
VVAATVALAVAEEEEEEVWEDLVETMQSREALVW